MDPIGDMLTSIRNALKVKKENVEMPSSRVKEEMTKILKEEGFIDKYEALARGRKKILRIELKYTPQGKSVITYLKRVSKPGRRIYVGKNSIPLILRGFGISILSTSKGILSDQEARRLKIGGEILCSVW